MLLLDIECTKLENLINFLTKSLFGFIRKRQHMKGIIVLTKVKFYERKEERQ